MKNIVRRKLSGRRTDPSSSLGAREGLQTHFQTCIGDREYPDGTIFADCPSQERRAAIQPVRGNYGRI
jgi:hypothetical protein